jgi:osmotically inducible protein OsmC
MGGVACTRAGTLTSGSGALDGLAVTWASRTDQPDGETSPEELIAGAHASCFAMALALVLGENKTPPEHLSVSAACTLDEVGARRESRASSSPFAHTCPGSRRPV